MKGSNEGEQLIATVCSGRDVCTCAGYIASCCLCKRSKYVVFCTCRQETELHVIYVFQIARDGVPSCDAG